ncbi:threonine/serine exporter family protein [Terrilactibacillus sp. S3-3]|nr:threonine/serine exporter family protein [Terrilactibacillus sp. S3-3]
MSLLIVQVVLSFIATAAFGILFNIPGRPLVQGGVVGMIGWMVYFVLYTYFVGAFAATFVAAFAIAIISQFFAKFYKTPVIVYSVSGIIPLVPGGLSYDVMHHFVENSYNMAIELASKAFILSGAIAMGLIFAEVFHQVIKKSSSAVKVLKK